MFSCDVHSTGIIFVTAQCLMSGIEVAQDPTASLFLAVGRALASCQHRTATSCRNYIYIIIEGSLEVKLPTIWTDEKQRWEESAKRREEERRSKKRKSQKKEDPGARKVGKTVLFQWFVAPEGRKVGSLKRRVRSPLGRWEMKNCTPLWREAHFEVKMHKAHQVRTTIGSWDVEKVHAVVARCTFRSQKCQKLTGSEHFWKLRCRKSARCCGAKHISKSKC